MLPNILMQSKSISKNVGATEGEGGEGKKGLQHEDYLMEYNVPRYRVQAFDCLGVFKVNKTRHRPI